MNKLIAITKDSVLTEVLKKGNKQLVQEQKVREIKGIVLYTFDPDLWLDYGDIIVRIEAEISALRWCIYEIEGREKDRYTRQNLTMSLIKRGYDFLDLRRRACEFMKVGEN